MTTYEGRRIRLALDLLNSFDPYLREPEKLQSPAHLHGFLQQHGFSVPAPPTTDDLHAARELRSRLRRMLGQPEAVARELNSLLRNFSAQPFVTEAFTLEWQPCETGSQSELLAAEAALGLAGALKSAGPERLKTCAASPCQDVFIDGSRNRSRRFCSERCANRYHAAAFRDRR